MCGIAGIISWNKKDHRADIARMNALLHHRGPDDSGLISQTLLDGGRLWLAHNRLSILDLSAAGHQPMASEDESTWLVYNGEIFNYPELRKELEGRHPFRSKCDTEVILHLYRERGMSFPEKMHGMFALALADLNLSTLYLVRDRLGKKPLYLYQGHDFIAFASELKAFYGISDFHPEIEPAALSFYLTHFFVPGLKTILKGVIRVEPGSIYTIRRGGMEKESFWKLHPPEKVEDPERETLEGALEEAVRSRLLSDVPVGVFLSGGLDSSLVTALAVRHSSKPIQSFSISMPGSPENDEGPYALEVARHLGTEHHKISMPELTSTLFSETLWHLEEPNADGASFPTMVLSRFAARHVKVVLTGEGADELFGGYPRYLNEIFFSPFFCLPQTLRKALAQAYEKRRNHSGSFLSKIMKHLPERREMGSARWIQVFNDQERRILMGNRFWEMTLTGSLTDPYESAYIQMKCLDLFRRLLYLDIKFLLADELLMKVDKTSMAHSLEARAPFLDHRFVRKVFQLPAFQKMGIRGAKTALKKMARRYLPVSIIRRPKQGFGVPIESWLRGNLKPHVEALRTPRHWLYQRELLDKDSVETFLDRFQQKSDVRLTRQVWSLVVLSEWGNIFLEGGWSHSSGWKTRMEKVP